MKTPLTMAVTTTLLIFNRLLFKMKNSRIHEPPYDSGPYIFYLTFSKKNLLTLLIFNI
jgi:hypothetical protein